MFSSRSVGIKYSPALGTVSPKHVLYSEILSVTSVMRKNSRWAAPSQTYNTRDSALASNLGLRRTGTTSGSLSRQGSDEEDLMAGFEILKRELRSVDDIEDLPVSGLLTPFLAIIRSPLSTGPIASAALAALHSFFACGILSANAVGIDAALTELSSSISHCKFEASDSSGDEVVLLRILTVIEDCMGGSLCGRLDDIEVCEMLETVLTTCVQMRLSEALRRSAELTLHSLVRTVFSRLHALDAEVEEKKLASAQDASEGPKDLVMTPVFQSTDPAPEATPPVTSPEPAQAAESAAPQEPPQKLEFGTPSLVELLRVVINILDPNDRVHTDSTRILALGILNTAFEVSGPLFGAFPSLRTMILDHGCKYLFQLARSDNPSIFNLALRTISTMLNTMRKHLKLQQELFLSFTLDRLAPPAAGKTPRLGSTPMTKAGHFSPRGGTPRTFSPISDPIADNEVEKGSPMPNKPSVLPARGETREVLLETVCQISQHPSFMVELFTNYDCDINSDNVFERLIDALTKSVYSEYYGDAPFGSSSSQFICLDLVLAFVNHMTSRASDLSSTWPSDFVSPDELMHRKSQKQMIQTGVTRFNTKPKTGLAFMEENRLIYHDVTAEDAPGNGPRVSRALSLARFLKSSTRLDKKVLGDFLSRAENIEVLEAFVGLFDFHGKPVADAMRELLESFRLPGESQQIERITETFAKYYFASKPAEVKSQDAVHVLSYSIIMLNTDLHNPQIRKRMSIEDYMRNLRGVNDGSDFSPEFLHAVYDSIRKREIVLPEEHTGQLGFEFAWKELLMRSRQSGELMICNTALFDKEMFKAVWKPVISSITYAFMTFDDEYVIERAIAGFRQCATLAGHFHLPDVFDYVVVSLSQATSLLSENLVTQVPAYPVVEVEGQSITVSSLAVKFGANLKGQLAAVVLFNIMNRNGNAIREGWTQVFEIFQNLFIHSLLPTPMLQMEDFLGGVSMIPLRGNTNQPERPQARNDGLLSTLSSYLMTPYNAQESQVPTASDADVENTLCALDCINTCSLEELYAQITQLELEPLVAAVRAIEALAYERTVARLQQESDDPTVPDGSIPPLDHEPTSLSYDPASVFLLEMMVSIVCQTPQHIEELWPIVFEHISALLSSSTRYSVLLIERAVVSLLRICLILATTPKLRDQIYISFDLLGGLAPTVANSVAEQIISGLLLIVQNHREVISSQTEWNLVLALVRSTVSRLEAARTSFELVRRLAAEGPEQCITVDNVSPLVAVLDDFAKAAGIVVEVEHQHARRRPKADAASSPIIDRGKQAVDLLFDVMKALPRLTADSTNRWAQLALPILATLSRHAASASREVHHTALSQLSRALLGPLVPSLPSSAAPDDGLGVQALFERVLYPLLDALLAGPKDADTTEMRVRAAALLCKAFMRFEVGPPGDVEEGKDGEGDSAVQALWIRILDYLDQLMRTDRSDQMSEAVPESLKNVILVMNAAGMLVPPPGTPEDARTARQQALWEATVARIEQFLPGFLLSVIPAPPPPAPAPAQAGEEAPTSV